MAVRLFPKLVLFGDSLTQVSLKLFYISLGTSVLLKCVEIFHCWSLNAVTSRYHHVTSWQPANKYRGVVFFFT